MNTKIFLKLSIIVALLFAVISCANAQHKSIEKIAGLFKNNELIQINEIEKTDFDFVFSATLSEVLSSSLPQGITSQNIKSGIIGGLRDVEWLKETLNDLNLTWRMKIKNSVTGEEYDFAILPSDLDFLIDSSLEGLTPEQKSLAQSAYHENKSCPSIIDEGLILSSVRYTDGNIVYTYEVDEEINGQVKEFYNNANDMADSIIEFFSSEIWQIFLNQCAKAGANIYLDYFGQSSGKIFRYVFDTKTKKVTYSLI